MLLRLYNGSHDGSTKPECTRLFTAVVVWRLKCGQEQWGWWELLQEVAREKLVKGIRACSHGPPLKRPVRGRDFLARVGHFTRLGRDPVPGRAPQPAAMRCQGQSECETGAFTETPATRLAMTIEMSGPLLRTALFTIASGTVRVCHCDAIVVPYSLTSHGR